MSNQVRERPKLDLDLSDFEAGPEPETRTPEAEPTAAEVEKISEQAGFTSRTMAKTSRRRNRKRVSPFQDQVGIKCRTEIKDLFHDIGDKLDIHDHTTFETALHALLVQMDDKRLLARFEKVTKPNI